MPKQVVQPMPALTLWEPWASAIAVGLKLVETRSWRPPPSLIGVRIAIHSAKRSFGIGAMQAEVVRSLPMPEYRRLRDWCTGDPEMGENYPRGMVLATAVLLAAVRTESVCPDDDFSEHVDNPTPHLHRDAGVLCIDPVDRLLGDYAPGRWAWVLSDVRRLRPAVPARGGQRIWTWAGTGTQ